MKKLTALLLSVLMLAGVLTGCGAPAPSAPAEAGGLKIVTTIFPEYDWVRQIMGDRAAEADVRLLLKNGVDLHSYQPTTGDLVDISTADLFIYVGGPSDVWVQDALKNATNEDMVVIDLFDVLADDVKPLRLTGTMEHDHEDEDGHHHDHSQPDEHVWLSLKRAEKAVDAIAAALEQLDPEHSGEYEANAAAYLEQLGELDSAYAAAVEASPSKTLVFADRFPFFYLTDDYGMDYYAAFTGCSSESEASFETVAFLAGKVDELGIDRVLTIENCSHKVPQTVIENTQSKDQQVLVLNSLQSVTTDEIDAGLSYLDVMRSNLDVLEEALHTAD